MTIEDRICKALKEIARRSGKSFVQVVNETLERGLAESATRKGPYRERPVRLGGARTGYDLTKALSLASALEDEEILAVRSRSFASKAHQQSLAVAKSDHASDDQDFIDAISEWEVR